MVSDAHGNDAQIMRASRLLRARVSAFGWRVTENASVN